MNGHHRSRRLSLLVAVLGLLMPMLALAAVTKAPRPTEAIAQRNCTTSECHVEITAYPVLHGPAGSGTCDACHSLTSAKDHTFTLWREGEKTCTYCHEFDTGMLPVVHAPVTAGECLGCHNPHGGTDRSFTREATMNQTCNRCHDSVTRGRHFLHEPAANDDCLSCHRAHASKYPMMLDVVGDDLCLECHRDYGEKMREVQFVHEALDKGCTECHDPHGSDEPMAIKQSISDLCLRCHEDVRESMAAPFEHPAAVGERSCLTCHTAHGGNLSMLMRDEAVRICMECHDDTDKGKKQDVELITAMLSVSDPSIFKHTPVREGECGGCHSIHGGYEPNLLHDSYSTRFYLPYSAEKYDLCFCCHDDRMIEETMDPGITEFRNGDLNLHYLHVVKKDAGINCRVCHGIHTSKYPALIRDKVPYGDWIMDTKFLQTVSGGTCMTGCHPEYSYDRVTPVASKTSLLASEKVPRVPKADKDLPIVASWSGIGLGGTPVTVPVAGHDSVVVLLRADQAQDPQVIRMIAAATPQVDQARVVVVFCGENAMGGASEFSQSKPAAWSVVADPGYEVSGLMGVETWPATLVVKPDGTVVAHVGGAPPSLTLQVQAFLDLAAGAIDRATLRERLAKVNLVGDDKESRATWHLYMGRRLLDEGRAEEAQSLIKDGLRFQPGSIDLQVEMIRALVELNQPRQAMEILGKLPEDARPAWERELLRGRILAQQGKWAEARSLAGKVLGEKPDLREAHLLLGKTYEGEGQWEKAAEAYRNASRMGN